MAFGWYLFNFPLRPHTSFFLYPSTDQALFQIPEPPSGFKDDSVIQRKTEKEKGGTADSPSSTPSTSDHESPITVGETKPVLPQQDADAAADAAAAVSNDSGTELSSSSSSSDNPRAAEVTAPPPPLETAAAANGNSEADDTYSYCSGLNCGILLLGPAPC